MVLIGGASRIDERHAVDHVEEGMVRVAEDHAVNMLAEQLVRLLRVRRPLLQAANIVGNSNSVAIEVLDPRVRKAGEVELEAVSSHRKDFSVSVRKTRENFLALDVPRVDDDIDILQEREDLIRNRVRPLPVRVGKDCYSHGEWFLLLLLAVLPVADYTPAIRLPGCVTMTSMQVTIAPRTGLTLNNPVIAASGTFGYGLEFARRMDVTGFGAIVSKGTTREPRAGTPPVRLVETAAGMLNAIGLQNVGVEAVVKEKAPAWQRLGVPVLVNVSGAALEEYREVVSRLDGVPGVSGIELNISCPNVKEGGVAFGAQPGPAAAVTAAARAATSMPLVVKLSPNVADIRGIASAVEDAGADALTVANTVYGMAIDARRRTPLLTNITGGLSGPAIKPYALYLVYQVAQEVSIPIIAAGGIMTGVDAIEFLLAGATAVQLGTALLVDPACWRTVIADLEAWCRKEGVTDVREIIGAANEGFKGKTGEVHLAG